MLKKTFLAGLAVFGLAFTDSYAGLSDDDYIEAAWMTTRFYGAQRSGQGPNWVLDGTNNPTSFTGDKYNGKDVSGGWFDCGDHVMYGQTQGYSSYVLAVSFAEFTKGFYDLYTGDYTDYKSSKDYTRKGGKSNDVRDLLEELRYEADFWVKAAIDENNFVTVKGDGNSDHNKWVTAGAMTKLGSGDGGEPRYIKGNADDAYTPGMAAAMLAVMARIDPDESAREKYLKAAKTAFAYAKKHKGVTNSQGFYESSWWNNIWEDGPFLAATELYRTTKDESYKSEAQKYWDKIDFSKNSYSRFSYSDASPLSYILGEFVFGFNPRGDYAGVQNYLDKMYQNQTDSKGIFNKETGGPGKFSTRTPAGGAFLYALYSKFAKDDSYDADIEKNIAYLLGDNSNKKSYVVGFNRNGANAPTHPHHRGYYANEDPGRDVNGAPNPPEKNKLLGGMIAGDFTSGSHSNSTAQWQVNEVCLDLNAPLVGALGYILSKKAPVEKVASDVEEPEEKKPEEEEESIIGGRILNTKAFSLVRNTSSITVSSATNTPFAVQVFGINGKIEQEMISDGHSLNIGIQNKGLKIIKVSSKDITKTFKVNGI
uniref:Putative carbohydrate-active enzyme n=1 Tax=uncultured organism TaxID=155900 RepID=E9NSM8_9ZZZZ|nr:putative carbohydrate-active enzyme [uncultured organism]